MTVRLPASTAAMELQRKEYPAVLVSCRPVLVPAVPAPTHAV